MGVGLADVAEQRHLAEYASETPRMALRRPAATCWGCRRVHLAPVSSCETDHGRTDLVEHGLHGLLHPFAAANATTVTQLDGLMLAGRGAMPHGQNNPLIRTSTSTVGYRGNDILWAPTCSIIGNCLA